MKANKDNPENQENLEIPAHEVSEEPRVSVVIVEYKVYPDRRELWVIRDLRDEPATWEKPVPQEHQEMRVLRDHVDLPDHSDNLAMTV